MTRCDAMKRSALRGWNTWNMRSMLSHALLPQGLSLDVCLRDARESAYLKEADVGAKEKNAARVFPGPHAWDGSYTELRLEWYGTELKVRSCTEGEDLLLLVTPLSPLRPGLTLVCEAGLLWGRPGTLEKTPDGRVRASLPDRTVEIFQTGDNAFEPYVPAQTPYLAARLTGARAFCTGRARTLAEIASVIEKRGEAFQNSLPYEGDLRDAASAMQTCLAWDTVYDPVKDRMISTVSRRWDKTWGGYVLFCWDNYFAASMAAACGSREAAYSNLIEITAEKTEAGFVPNFACAAGVKSWGRSQPPVGADALYRVYRRYGEIWPVEALYDDLLNWNTWWFEHRQILPGLFAWGSDPFAPVLGHWTEKEGVNDWLGASLESGLDNSPMYDDIPFDEEKHMLCLADVGLTGLIIMDLRALAALARLLGRDDRMLKERLALCEKSIQRLWNDEIGMFCNLRTDTGEYSLRLSPTNFYALYSSSVTPYQRERILNEHFYNEREFWGDYVLPSIARDDPAYPDQEYWRGRIWAPMNYLVYEALRFQGEHTAARALARKSLDLILKEWREKGHVHENYDGDTGEGCNSPYSDAFYHWGGLLALMGIEEFGQDN